MSRGRASAARRRARHREEVRARAEVCGVRVSDHAVIRYLQRAYRLDLSLLYTEILPPGTADVAARLGNGDYPVETAAGPHLLIIRDGAVVSVVTPREPDHCFHGNTADAQSAPHRA